MFWVAQHLLVPGAVRDQCGGADGARLPGDGEECGGQWERAAIVQVGGDVLSGVAEGEGAEEGEGVD